MDEQGFMEERSAQVHQNAADMWQVCNTVSGLRNGRKQARQLALQIISFAGYGPSITFRATTLLDRNNRASGNRVNGQQVQTTADLAFGPAK